jgi:hypothetical protein
MRFLDDAFCVKLAQPLGLAPLLDQARKIIVDWPQQKKWLEGELAARRKDEAERLKGSLTEGAKECAKAEAFVSQQGLQTFDTIIKDKVFESQGWDVAFDAVWRANFGYTKKHFSIDIKPSLGDDFPGVLRQMKAQATFRGRQSGSIYRHPGYFFLVVDAFTATGATFEQVKAMFAADNFTVLRFDEIK